MSRQAAGQAIRGTTDTNDLVEYKSAFASSGGDMAAWPQPVPAPPHAVVPVVVEPATADIVEARLPSVRRTPAGSFPEGVARRNFEKVARSTSGAVFSDDELVVLRLHDDVLVGTHAPPPSKAPVLLVRADAWLRAAEERLNETWEDAHRSVSPWDDQVFEWWNGDKKLTVYFGSDETEYVRVWGEDIDNEMDDGTIDDDSDFDELWHWLRT